MIKLNDNPIRNKFLTIKHAIKKAVIIWLVGEGSAFINCRYNGEVDLGSGPIYDSGNEILK